MLHLNPRSLAAVFLLSVSSTTANPAWSTWSDNGWQSYGSGYGSSQPYGKPSACSASAYSSPTSSSMYGASSGSASSGMGSSGGGVSSSAMSSSAMSSSAMSSSAMSSSVYGGYGSSSASSPMSSSTIGASSSSASSGTGSSGSGMSSSVMSSTCYGGYCSSGSSGSAASSSPYSSSGAGSSGASSSGASSSVYGGYGSSTASSSASSMSPSSSSMTSGSGASSSGGSSSGASSSPYGGYGSSTASSSGSGSSATAAPTAAVLNGTYTGVHSSGYNQDFFLGMPFAQPPVGQLRFTVPQSLNTSWSGSHSAMAYSPECVGYGGDQIGYAESEDCLYINVVRPAGYEGQQLPVAVWIHGGGFVMGGAPDRRYNLSFIVENAVSIGKPFIGVSTNYRLTAWGFLNGDAVLGSGNTNLGLRDQRLALHWVQENIAAFGGDPTKVTIWGESAGAASVGFHLTAYGGRDDKLFRAGIMESGNPIAYGGLNFTDEYQPKYDLVVQETNCSDAVDTLECLRGVPFAELNAVLNTTALASAWNPYVDGDFIEKYTSIQVANGEFVHVPIIDGANTDEGTAFTPQGINTTQDFINLLHNGPNNAGVALPLSFIDEILAAYPDDPCVGIPTTEGCARAPAPFGYEYRRAAAYTGDEVFIAPRRATCTAWAAGGVPAYCYRFDAWPAGVPYTIAATHFQEVVFVFHNWLSAGYATDQWAGVSPANFGLSELMSSSWASFIVDLDPNTYAARNASIGAWPVYSVADPMDFVFSENVTSYAEPDTYRAAGMALINSAAVLYRR